ncbi:flavin reductase family protein [Streptomyces sp. NPDC052095]|uniref:flavin reductase family protein n=1 Tax=unclassified Streptomyces TaxID=2593676 RepID=UPI00344ECA32
MRTAPSHQAAASGGHRTITPSILYFGTPVVLLTTENPDGTFNLAPISSAWALGQVVVLGLSREGRTGANLEERPELVISLPEPGQWTAVERLGGLTGRPPETGPGNRAARYEPDKFSASGFRAQPSRRVRPPRVAECPIQLEARAARVAPDVAGEFLIVEARVVKVHADERLVVPGTQHIDPGAWSPLIYNFRHYFGLGPEIGHSGISETPREGRRILDPGPQDIAGQGLPGRRAPFVVPARKP